MLGLSVFGLSVAAVAQRATVELPTVDVAAVLTTVGAPTQGMHEFGRFADADRRMVENGPPSQRAVAAGLTAGTLAATAQVVDLHTMDAVVQWRLVRRDLLAGDIRPAVDRLRRIERQKDEPGLRDGAVRVLAALQTNADNRFREAAALVQAGAFVEAAGRIETLRSQYGPLLRRPEQVRLWQALVRHPEVAQVRDGRQAAEHLADGEAALAAGDVGVAAVHFRMAAGLAGTTAAEEAADRSRRLPEPRPEPPARPRCGRDCRPQWQRRCAWPASTAPPTRHGPAASTSRRCPAWPPTTRTPPPSDANRPRWLREHATGRCDARSSVRVARTEVVGRA